MVTFRVRVSSVRVRFRVGADLIGVGVLAETFEGQH